MPRHLTTDDSSTFVPASDLGAANGVATLDPTGKVPTAQLPSEVVTGVSSVNNMTGNVTITPAGINAVATTQVGQPNGVASLDANGKIPLGNVPSGLPTSINGHTGNSIALNSVDVRAVPTPTRRLTIYYSLPNSVNGRYSNAYAEQLFSGFDQIVFNSLIGQPIDTNTVSIIAGIQRLNLNATVFGYVDIGITSGPTDVQIDAQINAWKTAGVQGVFFDRAGWNDASTTRARQNTHVATAHGLGLSVVLNCFNPDDAYLTNAGSSSSAYWSSFNPGNVAPLVGPNDWYLLESWCVNTAAYNAAPPAASSLGYAGMSSMQDRGDRAISYRNAGGPKVMAVGLVEYYKNTDATSLHYHRMTEAAAIVWGMDSYGTCAYQYAASGGDATVVKTYPFLPDAPAVISATEKYTSAVYQKAERLDLGSWVNIDTTGLVSPVPSSPTDPVHFNWSTPSRARQDALLTVAGPISSSSISSDSFTDNQSGAITASGGLNVLDYLAVGNGTTDDTTAIQSALNAAVAGQVVLLPPGHTFGTSAPLKVPPGVVFAGTHGNHIDSPAGPVIKPLSSFSGSCVISMVDQTTGGYSVVSNEQQIRNLNIDGSNLPGGNTVHGIYATGYVHGVVLENLQILNVGGNGIAGVSNGSGNPYSWRGSRIAVKGVGGYGYNLSNFTDSTWYDIEAIGCTKSGLYINGGAANSHFTDVRSEWSGFHGVELTGAWGTGTGAGGVTFTSVSTDRNTWDGIHITSTGTAPIVISGAMLRRDGRNGGAGGGNYAGFNCSGSTTPVIVTGLSVFPGVDDNGTNTNSPQYGFKIGGAAQNVVLTSGYVQGASTGIYDDGTSINFFRNPSVLEATGTTSSPTLTTGFPWSTRGQQSVFLSSDVPALYVSNSAANTNNPLLDLRTTTAGSSVLKARAVGDTSSRVQMDNTGNVQWGDGTSAKDVTLRRNSAGELRIDQNLSVGGNISGIVTPSAHGMISWSYDPTFIIAGKAGVAGTLYLVAQYIAHSTSTTKIQWGINSAGVSPVAGQNWVGLYNGSGTLIANAGVDSNATSTGEMTTTISSTAVTPGVYWIAFLFNCSTMPQLYRAGDINATVYNSNVSGATSRYATNGTGLTALPSSITLASNVSAQYTTWCGLA